MAAGSKSFPHDVPSGPAIPPVRAEEDPSPAGRDVLGIGPGLQVAIGYLLLEASLWSPPAVNRALWMTLATGFLLFFSLGSGYSKRELGLGAPSRTGALRILTIGLLAAAAIPAIAILLGQALPANPNWPPARAIWEYTIWAMAQQFILQSFFYVRLESVLGSQSAVIATALLFAGAHLPNPMLTAGALLAAVFFCEMFRRYRSIYPLGMVHAALGLALAESIPDRLIHHLRVGMGYLHFHAH